MAANAKEYREYLYRTRAHPAGEKSGFTDQRDSFAVVYLSILPFLVLEYFAELQFAVLPSGVVFPIGYLLFWAFFYTYYRPGLLEDRLSDPKKWELAAIPSLVMGVILWFVKVTLIELTQLIFVKWLTAFFTAPAPAKPQRNLHSVPRPTAQTPPPTGFPLPSDLANALAILGISSQCRDWNLIHRRYRELAKQYHPDLNAEKTDIGRRFMLCDAAYRKLQTGKGKYFFEAR